MRLKYTSFKSLTLKSVANAFVLGPAYKCISSKMMRMKERNDVTRRDYSMAASENAKSICFVDSTHYLNNCKLRNKYNYYCSFSISLFLSAVFSFSISVTRIFFWNLRVLEFLKCRILGFSDIKILEFFNFRILVPWES